MSVFVRIVFIFALVFSVSAFAKEEIAGVEHDHFIGVCSDKHIAFDGYCFGYIKGILDTIDTKFCLPEDVMLDQIKKAAISYIDAHPELLHKPTADLVAHSIIDTYPCG